MTQNRRILINILASYGRSVFALFCGLFSARWVLNALGHEDFGLYGLIGGLTIFITFFNGLMAGATSRFYAFSVGSAQVAEDKSTGIEECRAWFNTALMIHLFLPLILILIGYPIGYKIVVEFLSIPPEKLYVCIWVLRFVSVSCFIAMINVPFQAMFTAKQYIAELTVYSFAQTICTFLLAYYMISHPGDWLQRYALYMSLLQVLPQIMICIRAWKVFPECKIDFRYWWKWKRVREMWSYAGWQAFAGVGGICRGQGMAMLINKYFGPQINASMTIANQVSSHTMMLSGAMVGAFQPAITNACGARKYEWMRLMAFRACKFGTLLILIFLIPLAVEIHEVLSIWLKNPPPYTESLCLCMLGVLVIDKSTVGHMVAVNANGKVALYQAFLGSALIFTLPIAWILVLCDVGVISVGYAFLVATALSAWGRTYFAQKLVGMNMKYWFHKVFLPLSTLILCSAGAGLLSRLFMCPSVSRIFVTTVFVEVVLLPLSWLILFSADERIYVKSVICKRLNGIWR